MTNNDELALKLRTLMSHGATEVLLNQIEAKALLAERDACRAAMLKAGTVTRWIKCSDRMPDERQEVIVMDAERNEVQSGMIYHDGRFVDFNEEYYEVENPSHWMPLPAAPEQEV